MGALSTAGTNNLRQGGAVEASEEALMGVKSIRRPEPRVVIGISGSAGSGKTTFAEYVAKEFNLKLVSAGKIFREIAARKNLSLEELSKQALQLPEIDFEVERRILEEAREGNVVVEGHLAAWTVSSFADLLIYFDAPLETRVRRIAQREGRPVEVVLIETTRRELFEAVRYRRVYNIDITDHSIFHVRLDTSIASKEEIKAFLKTLIEKTIKSTESLDCNVHK